MLSVVNKPFMLSVAKLSVVATRKYQTRLEKLATSLLCHFVSDEEEEVLL
jgi:hypothetical protein